MERLWLSDGVPDSRLNIEWPFHAHTHTHTPTMNFFPPDSKCTKSMFPIGPFSPNPPGWTSSAEASPSSSPGTSSEELTELRHRILTAQLAVSRPSTKVFFFFLSLFFVLPGHLLQKNHCLPIFNSLESSSCQSYNDTTVFLYGNVSNLTVSKCPHDKCESYTQLEGEGEGERQACMRHKWTLPSIYSQSPSWPPSTCRSPFQIFTLHLQYDMHLFL